MQMPTNIKSFILKCDQNKKVFSTANVAYKLLSHEVFLIFDHCFPGQSNKSIAITSYM